MDLQKLLDAISDTARNERSKYHVTLGSITAALGCMDKNKFVQLSDGRFLSVTEEHSYRGYYHDLAFEPSDDLCTVGEVLAMCERAAENAYEGYNGGEFRYGDDTPLWVSHYGVASGLAICGIFDMPDNVVLVIRDVD